MMRTTLFPGLLKTLIANASRQQTRVRLFELGRCFPTTRRVDAAGDARRRCCGVRRLPENWANGNETVDFFDLKGDVERVLEHSGYASVEYRGADDPVLHPGQSATVWDSGDSDSGDRADCIRSSNIGSIIKGAGVICSSSTRSTCSRGVTRVISRFRAIRACAATCRWCSTSTFRRHRCEPASSARWAARWVTSDYLTCITGKALILIKKALP